MKKLDLTTLVYFLKSGDYKTVRYASSILAARYGEEAAKILVEMAKSRTASEMKNLSSKLVKSLNGIGLEETSDILSQVSKGLKLKSMATTSIMEMFRSNDEFLVQKSKELIVEKFSKYVHSLIYKNYNPYAEAYGEELYQCGVIGLLKAMDGYDENKGMFTTYCKPFILHEITMQLNFLNNDTTVHFTNLQKRIRKAIDHIRDTGAEVSPQTVSIQTGISPEIVKREMDFMANSSLYYMDADDDAKEKTERAVNYEKTPDEIYAAKERIQCLQDSIDRLPDEIREVITLRYANNWTNAEISRHLNIKLGQVKSDFQKGLQMMKQDPILRALFPEYMTTAEREMMKYSMPVKPSQKETEEQIDSFLDLMGELDATKDGKKRKSGDDDDEEFFGDTFSIFCR